jgi:hypothetical protein
VIHKAKVLLELLDLAELRAVLDGSKELLKNAPPPEAQVQKTITHLANSDSPPCTNWTNSWRCIP